MALDGVPNLGFRRLHQEGRRPSQPAAMGKRATNPTATARAAIREMQNATTVKAVNAQPMPEWPKPACMT